MIRYDTIQYDTIRYDTIRYDTIRYDRRRADSTVPKYEQNVSMRVTAAAGRVGEVEIEAEAEVGVEDVSVLF
jgi:hypothetical protein